MYILIAIVLLQIAIVNNKVDAKYSMQNEFYIANIDIDNTKPKIEIISITNDNVGYNGYANKNNIINIEVKFTDKNIENIFLDENHIKFKLDDENATIGNISFIKQKDETMEKIYKIELKNIEGNGKLKIEFMEGIIEDLGELKNEYIEYDTNIIIDNIAPTGEFTEEILSDGKSKGSIVLNELIRELEGWNTIDNGLKIEKEFTNKISYELPIYDLAGNKTIININLKKPTYINLVYASHNSEIGWTYGYGNYDIAGKKAAKTNLIYKTEGLAFNIEGNVDDDFVQARAYMYTHWGEGSYAKDYSSHIIYNYGYNPNDGTYKSMSSSDLVTRNNKKYFQFGGSGVNSYKNTDTKGKNPIPKNLSYIYPYGICGMNIKLKDYSEFSVIYQILVKGYGWSEACSDDQECIQSKTSPMSAFRMALVPKSEKQYVIDTFNKYKGTYNLK